MAAAVLANDKQGAYNADNSANALCENLTTNLREISQDKHIRLRFSPDGLPEDIPEVDRAKIKPSAAERERELAMDRQRNFGIEKFEHLPGNIAYLELGGFLNAETSGDALAAAMRPWWPTATR